MESRKEDKKVDKSAKFGYQAIAATGTCGMPESHMKGLMQAAEAKKSVFMIRPVSPYAAYFLRNGYPCKYFLIKNKSCKIGMAAGLIPDNPLFSHVKQSEYKNHAKQIAHAFEEDQKLTGGVLSKGTLTLPTERITELLELECAKEEKYTHPSDPTIRKFTWEKEEDETSKKTMVNAYAKPKPGEPDQYEFFTNEECTEPLQVISRQVTNHENVQEIKPITADYDLFAVLDKWSEFDRNEDKRPFRTQGSAAQIAANIANEKQRLAKDLAEEKVYTGPTEDPLQGNVSKRIQSILPNVNEYIRQADPLRQGTGRETLFHNDETHNPYASVLLENMPLLMFLPEDVRLGLPNQKPGNTNEPILIQSIEDLRSIRKTLQDKGYYWPSHGVFKELTAPGADDKKISTASIYANLNVTKKVIAKNLKAKEPIMDYKIDHFNKIKSKILTQLEKSLKHEKKKNIKAKSPKHRRIERLQKLIDSIENKEINPSTQKIIYADEDAKKMLYGDPVIQSLIQEVGSFLQEIQQLDKETKGTFSLTKISSLADDLSILYGEVTSENEGFIKNEKKDIQKMQEEGLKKQQQRDEKLLDTQEKESPHEDKTASNTQETESLQMRK